MRKPWLNTIDFFIWIGCAELKSRNWWESVSLQYKSVSKCWSIKLTFTSKKLTDFLDFSLVNFKFGWKLFKFFKNSSSFSSVSPDDISGHKWSTPHRVLKSHRSKMSVIYMLSWKQCALPVITTMALWQLMHLGTWCTVTHCGDNREGILFSW